jgi:DNA polymerase-3 subunit delta'
MKQESIRENSAIMHHQNTPTHPDSSALDTQVSHPAYLWIGSPNVLLEKTIAFLQAKFCTAGGCGHCPTCTQIATQQHHAVIWLAPEKQYTLEDLEPIFSTIVFALAPDQHIFFVLQKADFLSTVCANKLLKSMEEPPAGYHFILLAQRQESILPTIRSRCISTVYSFETTTQEHAQLFSLFTSTLPGDPAAFLKLLDQAAINERESVELLDRLLAFWIKKNSQLSLENKNLELAQAQQVLTILKKAACMPPMPGSSKLFWKNLYLQIKQ